VRRKISACHVGWGELDGWNDIVRDVAGKRADQRATRRVNVGREMLQMLWRGDWHGRRVCDKRGWIGGDCTR
jgi:hypothetical protein